MPKFFKGKRIERRESYRHKGGRRGGKETQQKNIRISEKKKMKKIEERKKCKEMTRGEINKEGVYL